MQITGYILELINTNWQQFHKLIVQIDKEARYHNKDSLTRSQYYEEDQAERRQRAMVLLQDYQMQRQLLSMAIESNNNGGTR